MNKHKSGSKEMVSVKNISNVSCSTPEHRTESPSRDSDSVYDSDNASPVPFLCTQDGAEGETDVVWNFYTPKADHGYNSRVKNSTPVSRKSKRSVKPKIIVKQLPKRRPMKLPQNKTELFQELLELNELVKNKPQYNSKEKTDSKTDEDIFSESPEFSPKSRLRSNSRCLRRNVLSSNFAKPDPDAALESDDSMNECLIKASQIAEDNIRNEPKAKETCIEVKSNKKSLKPDLNFQMDQDSMDAILNSIKLKSPMISNVKNCDSPKLVNDSFDSIVGNLNDSALEKLTQMPVNTHTSKSKNKLSNTSRDTSSWTIKELVVHDSPSSKSSFSRHSSMPVSPSVTNVNLPSTSGMAFCRYNSMPFSKDEEAETDLGDSPIRCTPDEIKKKHQLARERLLAKRLLPFTLTQKTQQLTQPMQKTIQPDSTKKINEPTPLNHKESFTKKFQIRVPSSVASNQNKVIAVPQQKQINKSVDIKSIIERKRQEALMKLRRRVAPSK